MEKRIALEKRGRADDQIVELILDNCRSTSIEGLTDGFTALEVLSLINVGLVSLKSFPKLPNLRKLELSDNRISNGLNHLTGSPKLTHLNLSGNRIKEFEELKPLKEFENLEVLDLFNNEITSTEEYRDKIFELIPSLKYLDGFDKDDAEAPSDEEDGGAEEEDEDEVSLDDSDSYYDDIENDISLAEVYSENLEEDGSDWAAEYSEEGDDIDEPTDEDEEDGEGGEADGEDAEGEGEAAAEKAVSDGEDGAADPRGKKRKHDGNDG
ncbi:acidic leucine-rich nuclear phosphoprotein 32 family member A [Sabethes cyaneus]|uniref:acidic leucine-rich nuclear phosphoprotein 32 family member A n=1 Tax=Sabethes cyaneus TaxID=53552 RepID=UPI00221E31EE|nr:acidic leucine-rich nuclear phosphoprotein 32 family member A [Sabethes cyaneus]